MSGFDAVDGDPLDDIRNGTRLAGIMMNGQWLPRAKLDAQLILSGNAKAILLE